MRLTSPTKMFATAMVAVPAATAADIPAGQPAPGGDWRIATMDTNHSQIPQGFDFRFPSRTSVPNWPEGQPAPGGTGIDMDSRSTFTEGQPAPGGDGRVTTPYAVPVGFDFKAPADWVTATESSPVSFPTPGGFDFTDTVIGAAAALGAAMMALLALLALRRRGGLAHS